MSDQVYVGMSGGVDSSLTAALLKEQGLNVTGVYMKNWAQDLPGFECPWKEDLADAKRVAVQLDIPFKIFDFQEQYREKVVNYLLESYQDGLTPNPDIMCNQEIKFKLFLDASLEDGADKIATGHYARTLNGELLTSADSNKDQTYFLYRVNEQVLKKTLFPLGEYKSKEEVRQQAKKRGLVTADKKDSMGICFVGKVGIKDFLSNFIDTEPGDVIDQDGKTVGSHEGAIFYTIGQRHGLNIGGGLPYYVVDKNMDTNEVYVTTNLDDERLWLDEIELSAPHWINKKPVSGKTYQIRTRHRADLSEAVFINDKKPKLKLESPIRAVTPGQSAVVYDKTVVLGGGIIV